MDGTNFADLQDSKNRVTDIGENENRLFCKPNPQQPTLQDPGTLSSELSKKTQRTQRNKAPCKRSLFIKSQTQKAKPPPPNYSPLLPADTAPPLHRYLRGQLPTSRPPLLCSVTNVSRPPACHFLHSPYLGTVKIVAIGMAIWVLLLTLLPCNDVDDHSHGAAQPAIEVVQISEAHPASHDPDQEHCTPFCHCQCCRSTVTVDHTPIVLQPSLPLEVTYPYIIDQVTASHSSTVWHPPLA